MSQERITPDQFDALASLISMKAGPSMAAARAVLVDGARGVDAAAQAGIGRSGASDAVKRITRALTLARRAAGVAEAGGGAVADARQQQRAAVQAAGVHGDVAEPGRRFTLEEAQRLEAAGYEVANVTLLTDVGHRFAVVRGPGSA